MRLNLPLLRTHAALPLRALRFCAMAWRCSVLPLRLSLLYSFRTSLKAALLSLRLRSWLRLVRRMEAGPGRHLVCADRQRLFFAHRVSYAG